MASDIRNGVFVHVAEPVPHILSIAVAGHGVISTSTKLLFDSHKRGSHVVIPTFVTTFISGSSSVRVW